MKEIPLSAWSRRKNYGLHVAVVDDCDFDWAVSYQWSVDIHERDGLFYAFRQSRDGFTRQSKKTKHYMHREIAARVFGDIGGKLVDHRDSNGLNNTRGNIRLASPLQNIANKGLMRSNTSGFKGVSWHKQVGKWRSRIRINGAEVMLGWFDSAEDAAQLYDAAALDRYGEFARLNFPSKGVVA